MFAVGCGLKNASVLQHCNRFILTLQSILRSMTLIHTLTQAVQVLWPYTVSGSGILMAVLWDPTGKDAAFSQALPLHIAAGPASALALGAPSSSSKLVMTVHTAMPLSTAQPYCRPYLS